MNRELLEQPFSPNQVKQRPGTFGRQLSYIEGHDVIKRLNDAFDGNWSFQIISHQVYEDEIIVLGQLSAEGISKSQFGSSQLTKNKDTGAIVSRGDDFKSAATDSLKKAASLLGVGLHLYNNDKPSPKVGTMSPSQAGNSGTNHTSNIPASTTHPTTNHTNQNQNGRISSKQHTYLINLAQERGVSKQDLNQRSIEGYGSAVAFLSKHEASEMIAQMLNN